MTSMTQTTDTPMRDASCDGGAGCVVCGAALASTRARYCSRAHQQRAFRLRQHSDVDLQRVRLQLQRRRALISHTVYECPSCSERFVGVRRCPECNLFSRAIGLGGHCPECEAPVLLVDLLGEEVIAAH
jgi:hypothetical protein